MCLRRERSKEGYDTRMGDMPEDLYFPDEGDLGPCVGGAEAFVH